MIAVLGPFRAMKEFICKLFIKVLRILLKFLEICAVINMPCSLHIILIVEELMVEGNSFDVRRSSLIIFLFLLNHEKLYCID